MRRKQINVGDRFGKLVVIKEVEPRITPCGTKKRKFLCKCECGNVVVRELAYLKVCNSCGCDKLSIGDRTRKYSKESTSSFIYTTWLGMRQRCYDVKSDNYHNYGGRGICICDEWLNNYESFYNWSLKNGAKKGFSIDRINNNGNYEPSNCRWVDVITQANNTRVNRIIEYNNETHTLSEWSRIVGIDSGTIRSRLDLHGYSVGEALGFVEHQKINHSVRKYNWKKIQQFTNDGKFVKEWDGVTDIAKAYNCSKHCIQMCCIGRSKSALGFVWKYKE